jgi:hypothetical protein
MSCRRTLAASLLVFAASAAPLRAGGWQGLNNQPSFNASTMFLLMDGRVLVNEYFSAHWWILTPDARGSYRNGTWSKAANSHDDRLFYASSVLPDGRVIVGGGEYSNSGGSDKFEIYNPKTDRWKAIAAPAGWGYVGDAPSMILADGRFFIGNLNSSATTAYDPESDRWIATAPKLTSTSAEETWTLLPDGTVVVPDCVAHPRSELYDPSADAWIDLGSMPVDLVDSSFEIGPAMTMYDGLAFLLGATTTSAFYTPDPTPGGVGTWAVGPVPPSIGGTSVSAADAPASILPNGHILCALADGWHPPTYFCEFDGSTFTRVRDPLNNGDVIYNGRMLPLPTGEVLFANGTIYLYTGDGSYDPSWQPTITSMATDLIAGGNYVLEGTQLNGLSTANSFGDECAVATNYPLVRITFPATGHVYYCRCHDPSTMAIATGSAAVSTHLQLPDVIETGPGLLEVVANGIPSAPMDVFVRDPIVLDFDALATGVVVNTQYPAATFSAPTGYENWTVALNAGTSQPNVICTGTSGGAIDCTHDTYVDFRCPVASLTLRAVGVDDSGTVASVNVFVDGVLADTVSIEGKGDPTTPVPVNLTAYPDVTRIELVNVTDTGGIAWDDFQFCLASSASWSNYGAGFPGTLGEPTIAASARPILGTSFTVDLSNSLGSTTPGLLFAGFDPASILTRAGGTLLVDPFLLDLLSIDAAGTSLHASLPDDPTLCGVALYLQCLELDGGAAHLLSFTAGLELRLGY